jgi:hypothetical protein
VLAKVKIHHCQKYDRNPNSSTLLAATPAQMKALNALKFDLQVKSELNEPQVQKNFHLGNSKANCDMSTYHQEC